MTKVLHCRDIGFDCEGVIRAETDGEALAQAAAHTQEVFGLTEINDEVVEAVRASIRDES